MMTSEEVVADLREYALHAHASAWRARDGGHDYTMGAMLADNAADALEALAARVVALEAENARLREGLEAIQFEADGAQDGYDRNGPQWTSPQGNEYEDTSSYLEKFNAVGEAARAALHPAPRVGGE